MKTYTTPTYGIDMSNEETEGWLTSDDMIVTLQSKQGLEIEKSVSAGTATYDATAKVLYFSLSQDETARLGRGYIICEVTCKKSGKVGKSNTEEFYLENAVRQEIDTTTSSIDTSDLTKNGNIYESTMPKVTIEPAYPSAGASVHNDLTGRDADDAHPLSAITGLVAALADKLNKSHNTDASAHSTLFGAKQDTISDLDTIRSGASAGATAAQPADVTSAVSTHNSATDAHSDLFAAKQNLYEVTTSSSATVTLIPDETTVIDGLPTEVNVTLPAPASGIDYECGVIFKAGASCTFAETAPSGYVIEYADDDVPIIQEGVVYEILYRCLWVSDATTSSIIISAKYATV